MTFEDTMDELKDSMSRYESLVDDWIIDIENLIRVLEAQLEEMKDDQE